MAASCFFFLFCTPSVSNRSWLLSVSFQQLVLHTPVNLERERGREREREKGREREGGGGLSIEKDIDLRRERQWLPRVSSFYPVLLQSVTGHGSYIKNVTRYRKH